MRLIETSDISLNEGLMPVECPNACQALCRLDEVRKQGTPGLEVEKSQLSGSSEVDFLNEKERDCRYWDTNCHITRSNGDESKLGSALKHRFERILVSDKIRYKPRVNVPRNVPKAAVGRTASTKVMSWLNRLRVTPESVVQKNRIGACIIVRSRILCSSAPDLGTILIMICLLWSALPSTWLSYTVIIPDHRALA